MGKLATLVIGESQCTFIDLEGHILPADLLPQTIQIFINIADLDVAKITIPEIGFLDRHRFAKQRQQNQKASLLTGIKVFKDCLVEVSCPYTEAIQQHVETLLKQGKRISFIKPFIPPVLGESSERHTLIISDHAENGYRHTAFQDGKPIFTRLTTDLFSADEVLATLTYIKNQYQFKKCFIQCHLKAEDYALLLPLAHEDIALRLSSHSAEELIQAAASQPYSFVLPQAVQEAVRVHKTRLFNRIGAAAAVALICIGGWQYDEYTTTITLWESAQAQTANLDEKVGLMKANLPMEKLVPEQYLKAKNEPTPISQFHNISQALTPDITLSALKWENSPQEERILIEVKILNKQDEADQNVDVIQDFTVNLQDAMPEFLVQTQSLPHGSGESETFSGTAAGHDLTLDGDRTKARIQLIRKKQS